MKTVSMLCTKSPICTLIPRLLKALKSLRAIKNVQREEQKGKIREWKKKVSYTIGWAGRDLFNNVFIKQTYTYVKQWCFAHDDNPGVSVSFSVHYACVVAGKELKNVLFRGLWKSLLPGGTLESFMLGGSAPRFNPLPFCIPF